MKRARPDPAKQARDAIRDSFNVTGVSTYVFIDGDGIIRGRATGRGNTIAARIELTINGVLHKQNSK